MSQTSLLDELRWRGLLYQHTDGAADALARGTVTGYCGFDPTAASLHVGNLVPVMGLAHLQRAGHRPVVVVGGGTGMIGDPSGKTTERTLNTLETVEANAAGIKRQLEQFLDFSRPSGALMRNNADWLTPLGAIEFMRDVGKHFTINYMLAKESVQSRIDTGISYTEFSYMLLQAYDFLELYRREGATLQIGGSDQWGNITAGVELIRRTEGAEAHGVTLPLVTTAAGQKFGKTESGSVWLDAERTSPYKFYQFWINADDRDAVRYLKYFTLKSEDEIRALEQATAERPEQREAQEALAMDVTARVHGREVAEAVRAVSQTLFDRKADPRGLDTTALKILKQEIPFAAADGDVLTALVATGLVKSKGEARRLMQQGGVSVNGRKLAADETAFGSEEALQGRYYLLRKGARDMALVEVGGAG